MQFHCQNIIQALILTNVFLLFMHIAYNITGNDITFWVFYHAVLEKEMATHSIVLAWRIPGTGEPGGLPSMGSHRVGHDWSDLVAVVLCCFPPSYPKYNTWNWIYFSRSNFLAKILKYSRSLELCRKFGKSSGIGKSLKQDISLLVLLMTDW